MLFIRQAQCQSLTHYYLLSQLNIELREQAVKFKALALVETIGHTLAEEKMHEAEERAKSCEIAEAVLIGADSAFDVEGGVDA